jgi:hypothetical protein
VLCRWVTALQGNRVAANTDPRSNSPRVLRRLDGQVTAKGERSKIEPFLY